MIFLRNFNGVIFKIFKRIFTRYNMCLNSFEGFEQNKNFDIKNIKMQG